eukprot:6235658-Pyramimonas_sp.AAC.1
MEHPAPAEHRPNVPSSWYLPLLVRFARMPGVHLYRIDQHVRAACKETHVPSWNQCAYDGPAASGIAPSWEVPTPCPSVCA